MFSSLAVLHDVEPVVTITHMRGPTAVPACITMVQTKSTWHVGECWPRQDDSEVDKHAAAWAQAQSFKQCDHHTSTLLVLLSRDSSNIDLIYFPLDAKCSCNLISACFRQSAFLVAPRICVDGADATSSHLQYGHHLSNWAIGKMIQSLHACLHASQVTCAAEMLRGVARFVGAPVRPSTTTVAGELPEASAISCESLFSFV